MLMIGFVGTEMSEGLAALVDQPLVTGVIWFRRNIVDVDQVARVNEALRHRRPELLISVDQEGGLVRRLRDGVTEVPPMREVPDIESAAGWGTCLGRELRALGFNMNMAPVLDVDSNPDNPVIASRSFGRDPEHVARLAVALQEAMAARGVCPVGKHFPGHGDTDQDSHLALPSVAHDRSRLDTLELVPFRAAIAADIPAIMTAHVMLPALDPSEPATLSPRLVRGLLRDELGYQGVVITDDMEMNAVAERYQPEVLATKASQAGCDIQLWCHSEDRQWAALDALAEQDTRESMARIAALATRFAIGA
ncbi:MAG: beta-N-acetylhexosaminidase [Myxococcota bacterium]|jgi:beta-N-acetylhexosaminidase